MRITDLPAYKRISQKFETGEFEQGTVNRMPIYSYEGEMQGTLTPGHYVDAISYGKIRFADIPSQYLTRDFFVHALSSVHKDVLACVKSHLGSQFDREFFKEHIATKQYALYFEENCFEYMPLDYIDEEMISCAMLEAVSRRYVERRGDFEDWFYSVAKRKPEVLTQDFWTLGARLFAAKRNGKNRFLEITPKEYQTAEYYFAMCLENSTPVMEDFPKEILTTKFLVCLINDNVRNISSFTEEALEKEILFKDLQTNMTSVVKFWQAAILNEGYVIREIELNDERVAYFLTHYDKDSLEYRIAFKDLYKGYLKQKQQAAIEKPQRNDEQLVAGLTLAIAMSSGIDEGVDTANSYVRNRANRMSKLPIRYSGFIPGKFSKKYDEEEYLCEIYKKLGIEIIQESDSYYYEVKLPQNLEIEYSESSGRYLLKNDDKVLLEYLDLSPFYDRSVHVVQINCSLDK
ncbi:MAG: hypothetical protein HFJ28_00035 [Clostridia bacterium]|jgi:hypothetical protein|nr:hypothetical protein [Clostridia bacterium]